MEDKLNIQVNKNIKCRTCKYGTLLSPYNTWCTKYKLKPDEVLYEGQDCEHYVETQYRSIVDILNDKK